MGEPISYFFRPKQVSRDFEEIETREMDFEKTNNGKLILREALDKYIPKKITTSIKQGFSSPDESWFKGESMHYVKTKLMNGNKAIYKYFNFGEVESIVKQHLHGKENKRLFIWSLLNFEEWCSQFSM